MYLMVGAILVFGAAMGWAQSVSNGTVTGTVTMPDGTPTAGATVVIEGPTGQRTSMTDGKGSFVFLSVQPNTYTVSTSLSGFNTNLIEGVVVNAGSTIALNVALEIAAAEGEITVTSEAPIVDTRSSTVDTTFNEGLLGVVPTARDTFYDLSLTAAGMAAVGADESWLPSASAYGSATNENIFLVDGVDTTNPRGASWGSLVQVNYDTVQEVKVLSLGARAEYGSFSGAAVDVVTKSGGNQFHGGLGYYTMLGNAGDNYTTSFGNDWLYADPADDIVTDPITRDELSVTIGGPIIKDKLWFYVGYNQKKNETDTPLWIPLDVYKSKLFDAKVTADLASRHRLWAGYHYEDNRAENVTWGQTWDPSMRYDTLTDNTTLSLQYQWVASDTNLLGAKYLGYSTEQTPYTPAEVGHPGYINWWKWTGTQSIGVNGDFPYVEGTKNKRDTVQVDFTHYADNWAGSHELKFGVQYTTANGDWVGGYFQNYANFAYPYPWGYTYEYMRDAWWHCDYTWCLAPTDGVYVPFYNRETIRNPWLTRREANSTGFFVDDQWVLSDRITLNIGLRYDDASAKYGTGYVYEMFDSPSDVNNPTVLRSREGQDVYDFNYWSPRIGFAWDITGDAKTVLRGHYGRYYSPLGVESLRRFGPDMADTTTNTYIYNVPWDMIDTNGNGVVDFNETQPATALLHGLDRTLTGTTVSDPSWDLQVEPGTGNPYTDQFNLSIQRQLTKDLAIELTYIYKVTKDLLVLQPYDPGTGEFYQWESRPYTTQTGYESQVWSIVLEDYNGDGVINWSGDGDYVSGTGDGRFYRVTNVNEFDGHDVKQTYQGLQLVLNKRFSNRWQGMLAVNYTDTNGFYPRIVDQNWYIGGPLVMDTPFGSSYNHFQNNLEGPALMTPKWMAKIAGSYMIPFIETDFGFRLRYDSGRAIFQTEALQTYAGWMGDTPPEGTILTTGWGNDMVSIDPNQNDWMPSTTIVDLSLNKRFAIGKGMGIGVSFDALNVFNEGAPNRVGYRTGDYGRVYSLTTPRTFRLGVKFDF
jgi:outer membrane receptor protein involved in Fe transport